MGFDLNSKGCIFNFGEYYGQHVKDIPHEYIFWILPKLSHRRGILYHNFIYILNYYISLGTYIEYDPIDKVHSFYLKNFSISKPGGGFLPFLTVEHKMEDSKGNYVYEVPTIKKPLYIVNDNESIYISDKYAEVEYIYGGLSMVYERDTNYYFLDSRGVPYLNCYLMRTPYIPPDSDEKFSNNIILNENI